MTSACGILARNEIDAEEAADDLARLWAQYAWPVTLANQNLIGSHDTARFLTVAGGEEWRLRLGDRLVSHLSGRSGDLLRRRSRSAGRTTTRVHATLSRGIPIPTSHDLHRTIKELTRLRRKHPALVKGEWRPLSGEARLAGLRTPTRSRAIAGGDQPRQASPRSICRAQGKVLWGDAELDKRKLTIAPAEPPSSGWGGEIA